MPNPKKLLDLMYGAKEGGVVNMQDGGDPVEKMFNFNPMAEQAIRQERMRREAEEARRYKSVMGTTPQDFVRRVEPPPAEISALPLSQTPTRLDRLARSGLEALGMPKPRAQSVASNVKGAIEMLVPDPERIYREMSEATEERDPVKFALANLEAGLGYMPFAKPVIGAAKAIGATALDAGKVAGREMLRPIDQAMFGEGPLASLVAPVAPLQAVPRVQAPVSRLGFYDPVEQAGLNIQRKQGPGQAFLNELQRSENVSKDFLEASGIAERLRMAPNITREEVQAMTKGAVPEVQEVVLGSNVIPPSVTEFAKVHMPDFNPSNKESIAKLAQIADQRYQRAMAEGDLDIAEFAEQAETEAKKLASQYESGSKPADRPSKYAEYQLPGGKNYREVLLTVPEKSLTELPQGYSVKLLPDQPHARAQEGYKVVDQSGMAIGHSTRMDGRFNTEEEAIKGALEALNKGSVFSGSRNSFRSNHWTDPNVVSHIRMNDRTDFNGKKVLFIEEMQSDWAQEGRKKGFGQEVPEGPFVKNTNEWVDLSLKNIIKRAVDEGYDRVAFINGKQSADRYDLANYVDNIQWNDKPQNEVYEKWFPEHKSVVINTQNGPIKLLVTREGVVKSSFDKQFDDKKLDEVVGRDIARKIMAGESGSLEGEGLSVGGEGMKKFYDQIVPDRLRKLVGKDNVKKIPGAIKHHGDADDYEIRVDRGGRSYYLYNTVTGDSLNESFNNLSDAHNFLEKLNQRNPALPQLGFDITPEIREKFSKPIAYKEGGAVRISNNPDTMLLELMKAPRFQDGGGIDFASVDPNVPTQPEFAPFVKQDRPSLVPSAQQLKGAFERRVKPVITEAKQTALTGGILGDILRAYGEYSVPVNQAALTALGRPAAQEFPPQEPPEMTVPTAFERRGDLAQQLFGSAIGDPANVLDLGLMRSIGANVKPFAPTVKEIVERSSKDALNAGKQLSQTTKTINKEMPSQNKEVAYEQDLFTKQLKTPREDNESLFRVAEPSDVSKAKKDTVATPDLQSIHTVQLPTGQFATTTGFSTVQPIRTGFEFAKTPEQVAHITAGLRKSPQEQLVAVVLDKDDRPIQIIRHTIGISNQAAVEPFSLAGSIANTPGAKSFYISHNHPSGLSDLSAADKQISMMLNNLTANTGIENKGIMAVGKGTYSFSSPLGREIVNQNIPPAIRNKSINMVERVFKRSQVLDKNLISSADDARKMADKIVGDETGLMLLNQRYQPVGFLPVNEKSLLNLRKSGESTNILKALEKANANSAIFVTKKNLSQDQIDNIQKLFNAANVNMLDVLMGETRKSNAMNMSTRGTDFLSIAPPVAGASAIYESMEEPYKKGGKVHISNNPDTMRLELLRKKHA